MIAAEDVDGLTERDWQGVDAGDGPLRIAMIGIGWWTRDRAIPAVESSELCETTVAVSSSTEKANDAADGHPTIERGLTYEQFHEGIASEAYDAVYIATPNALHPQYAATAAELGKAILCEKPMADTTERASEMVETTREVTLMIAYRMHTEPIVRRMRELVREGFVGSVVEVRGRMSQRLLDMIPDPDQWRLDPDLSGYGASVMDLGIYPLNTARFVLDRDPKRVQASMYSASDGFEAVPDERASFLLDFPDGVVASCAASQNAFNDDRFAVIGTEGSLSMRNAFHSGDSRELVLEREGARTTLAVEPVDQMVEEFDYFADRVLRGEHPHPDGEHGLVDMRALEAIYAAAERDESVPIDD
jgi:xylose dehydrogenase (NAD/NADP)